jgi:hypothetical protein
MKIDTCPQCQGVLRTKKKECTQCGLKLETNFDDNPLSQLTREEQDYILEFVLSGGNFKALAEKQDLTYPTLRLRLDRIISKLESITKVSHADKILDAVDRGELKPEEGIQKLKKLKEGR